MALTGTQRLLTAIISETITPIITRQPSSRPSSRERVRMDHAKVQMQSEALIRKTTAISARGPCQGIDAPR